MKRHIALILAAGILIHTHALRAQENDAAPGTADQATANLAGEFLTWKFGMFIHFNIATFNNREWANGYEDPLTFTPDQLDCGQWADAAKAAGMKYAVLTVKHTGGYCLWDSAHTTHDITAFKNFKRGKGDIVREFVDAFRARGIKIGFYYCAPGDYDNRLGNTLPEGKPSLHGMPPEAAGDFQGFVKKQFTELLSNYGPVDLIWCDQYKVKFTLDQWYDIKAHIKTLQPNCLVIANNSHDYKETDIHSYEYPIYKDETAIRPRAILSLRRFVIPSRPTGHGSGNRTRNRSARRGGSRGGDPHVQRAPGKLPPGLRTRPPRAHARRLRHAHERNR